MDELSGARHAAERAAGVARDAAVSAAEKDAAAKSELDSLEASVRAQERLAAQIDQRLDSALAEAAALREVDERAAQAMEDEEVALAGESKAALQGQEGDDVRGDRGVTTGASSVSSVKGNATSSGKPKANSTAPKSSGSSSPPPGTVTWSDVTKVGSFWVHRSIASNVQGLLSAASAAGFNLTGGGFRDPASQIALRRAHCGTSYYDIYQRPASQCSPPTAIPGRSMHEQGRALDIKSGGVLITSRSSAAFQWLAANAARYGFYNLPSEPWHWSTNGT
ncbi:MAG: M15 family metallopeptidase [Microthrixaceae bacterium]|nr:M15 family metallopeptidase [Microthrixaceae bacterium]